MRILSSALTLIVLAGRLPLAEPYTANTPRAPTFLLLFHASLPAPGAGPVLLWEPHNLPTSPSCPARARLRRQLGACVNAMDWDGRVRPDPGYSTGRQAAAAATPAAVPADLADTDDDIDAC